MRTIARRLLRAADHLCATLDGGGAANEAVLVTALFHSVHRSRDQAATPVLAPHERITADDLRRFLDTMLGAGYRAVSPVAIEAGVQPPGRCLLVTFDDGYYNNVHALDALAEFRVPGVFFVSSGYVLEKKAFWWDVLARELRRSGASERAVGTELNQMKRHTPERIEASLRQRFGDAALRPTGDIDRPFTPDELRDFARNPWVHLGNHTRDHAILPNCDPATVKEQIEACQRELHGMTGYTPTAIAYPNGGYTPAVAQAARDAGLHLGLTCRPAADSLPLQRDPMTLGRYLVREGEDFAWQCRMMGAGFIPSYRLKSLLMSAG